MTDTKRYSVEDTTSYAPYRRTYSVRLPDVQQPEFGSVRYLETVTGRRRAWRSFAAAQKMADAMNVMFDKAMAESAVCGHCGQRIQPVKHMGQIAYYVAAQDGTRVCPRGRTYGTAIREHAPREVVAADTAADALEREDEN